MESGAGGTVATALRVRYAETDAMNVVYYANYLIWFEIGRTEWIRAHGISYRALEERDILLPVTHAACDYRQSARYDDLIRIETTASRLTRASVAFAYRIVRAEPAPEIVLAEGRSEHVFLSRAGQIIRLERQSPIWAMLTTAANIERR